MTGQRRTDPPLTPQASLRRVPDLRRLSLGYLVAAAVAPILLLVVLWLVLAGGLPARSTTAIGQPAPDFSVVDLDGNAVRLADLRGRPVVVNFWASWCVPCIEEFPLLRAAAERHADDDLAIVGIVHDDGADAARAFMLRHGGTWQAAMDPDGSVAAAYRVFGPPETYFIARDGTIAARQIGQFSERSLDEKLAAIIDGP
jgi:cytochrome c biogenesis protein CcmG, thiol:disulfide interchange protein DsbE